MIHWHFVFFYTIVRGPSVRPSGCVFGRSKSLLLLAKWSDPHQTCTQCSPGRSASTMCSTSRSTVTRYGQFCCSTKIAPGRSQMDGSSLISHHMEKTEAGLKGLCIREIMTKYTLYYTKYYTIILRFPMPWRSAL